MESSLGQPRQEPQKIRSFHELLKQSEQLYQSMREHPRSLMNTRTSKPAEEQKKSGTHYNAPLGGQLSLDAMLQMLTTENEKRQ